MLGANRGWTYKKAPVIAALYSTCVLNIRIPASPTERPIAGRPLDVQVFNSDGAEFSRFAMTELVNGILPNICNPYYGVWKVWLPHVMSYPRAKGTPFEAQSGIAY